MMLTSKETATAVIPARWRWSGLASIHVNTSTVPERPARHARESHPDHFSLTLRTVFLS